jgi:hypothetical protein
LSAGVVMASNRQEKHSYRRMKPWVDGKKCSLNEPRNAIT